MSERDEMRKRLFWRVSTACAAVLLPAGLLGLFLLGRHLGMPEFRLAISSLQLLMLPVLLAMYIGERVCRRAGLPLSTRSIEALARSPEHRGLDDTVRIQERAGGRWLPWLLGAQSVSAASSFFTASHPAPLWDGIVGGLGIAFTAAMLAALADSHATVEVSPAGIRRRTALRRWWKRIPWEDVGSCTVAKKTNHAQGEADTATYVFRDRRGRLLVRVPVLLKEDESARFLDAVRACYGPDAAPSELISAAAPEGTGIEPEAAMAPAGRGTEVEAALPVEATGLTQAPSGRPRARQRASDGP